MKFALVCAVLFVPITLSAAEDESPAFKVVVPGAFCEYAGIKKQD